MRKRHQLFFKLPSRTKQAFKDECDVNQILAKYQKTRLMTHVNSVQGNYGDFSNATDYQSSLNAVMDANARFLDLPATIRQKFNNSPASFIDFITDDQNYDEAAKLGLIDPEKHAARSPAPKPQEKADPAPKP